MRLDAALRLPALSQARLVGQAAPETQVRSVHIVDIPDPFAFIRPGQLLLTTGLTWPRTPGRLRTFARRLAACQPAGVVLAVPQFFAHFPPAALAVLDAAGLPALELPWDLPFWRVVEEVQGEVITRQYAVIERAEAIHEALTHAALAQASLPELATSLSGLLGRAVAFLDERGGVLALAGGVTPGAGQPPTPPLAPSLAQVAGGLALPHLLRGGPAELTLEARELPGQRQLVCPVMVAGALAGSIWLSEADTPLGELDRRAGQHAATVVGLQRLHARNLDLSEARLGYAFLDSLLSGQTEATPTMLERARRMGYDPARSVQLIALLLPGRLPLSPGALRRRDALALQARALLTGLRAAPLVSVRHSQDGHSQVLLLWPAELDTGLLAPLLEAPLHGGAAVLASRARAGWAGVAQSEREVQHLTGHARPGTLTRVQDLLLPRVLAADPEAQAELTERYLLALRAVRGGAALEVTLRTLVACGFQQAQAALRLGVHLNTLRYRLERVEGVLSLSLSDPETRHLIWLASVLTPLLTSQLAPAGPNLDAADNWSPESL